MLGAQGADQCLTRLGTAISSEVAKRLPRAPLIKYAIYRIAKEVAKWIGRGARPGAGELVSSALCAGGRPIWYTS